MASGLVGPHDAPDAAKVLRSVPAHAKRLAGLDVSVYQETIDWPAVARAGIAFAAVKATEGLQIRDPRFPANWAGCRRAGLVQGAYHFFYASIDGARQADALHAYVRDHGRFAAGDFVLLDVEEVSMQGASPAVVLAEVRRFVLRAREQIGKSVFIYTDPNTWRNLLGDPEDTLLGSCPLWLAEYGSSGAAGLRAWPAGPSFWQWTDQGRVEGIHTQVDLDTFFGGEEQLHALCHGVWPAG